MIEFLQIAFSVACCFGVAVALAAVIVNGLEQEEDEL